MLSNFQLGSHPLLQTLLLGQPEFRDQLHDHPELEQLRQRVIAAHHLDAMESTEVQPYIEHRMKCVGWDGNPAFDQRVFAEIYTASGGVPRRINQIANRLLLLGAVDKRTRIDAAMLSQVLSELTEDGTLSLSRMAGKTASQKEAAAPLAPSAARPEMQTVVHTAPADPAAMARIEAALSERDNQISELQQAVLELANANETRSAPEGGLNGSAHELGERLAALESRMIEQDRTIRHTLTMLIEWIESDGAHRAAA
jgi:general secretion pathway protein A